jgi:hypothetical protein
MDPDQDKTIFEKLTGSDLTQDSLILYISENIIFPVTSHCKTTLCHKLLKRLIFRNISLNFGQYFPVFFQNSGTDLDMV